jgi:pimeloyl-ACP methyl ester carboxylesterase
VAAASFRNSVSTGIAGWRDDDLALLQPWCFELGDIVRPVAIWQAGQDRMVPFAHGDRLAEQIPAARVHLLPGEGHLSIAVGRLPEVVGELVEFAGLLPEPN